MPYQTSSEKVVNVDAKTLLDNPQLLSRAMYSAVVSRNIAGIKVVLPIYEQWQGYDKNMALYAHGLVAQDEGKMKEAIGYYRQFIAETPDAPVVRWQLATALFEDKQNEAAADQFDAVWYGIPCGKCRRKSFCGDRINKSQDSKDR